MGPLKILQVSPAYAPAFVYGGPIISIHNLCKHLVRMGVQVDVLTTNANGNSLSGVPLNRFIDRDGVGVMYSPADVLNPFIFSIGLWKRIRSLIASYDLVHIQSVFTFNTLWAAGNARREKIPYVISPRGSLVKGLVDRHGGMRKRMWLRFVDRPNLESASAVHLTTEHERLAMRELGVSPRREEVIPNGVEIPDDGVPCAVPQDFRRRWGLADGDRLVLFLGRMNWEKGLDLLIPAFAEVSARYPDAVLLLAGPDTDGYLARVMKRAAASNVAGRIVATGQLNEADKWCALRECELVVLPSYSENFGLASLEGAAAGKPVVVSKEVGVSPEIREAGAGVVTEVTSDSIARAITGLMKNPGEAIHMGERGRNLVRERYLWSSVARKMLDLYEDILHSGNAG